MKKLKWLIFLVPVPFIIGLILNLVGSSNGNSQLMRIGVGFMSYGTPIVMFIGVVFGLILIITGRASGDSGGANSGAANTGSGTESTERPSAAEREQDKIDGINSSYGRESQYKLAEYQMEQASNTYHQTPKRERVFGWIFFGFLMTCFGLILVFVILQIPVGALVCGGLFVLTIITALIVTVIREKVSMSVRVDPAKYEQKLGTVVFVSLSSMTSTGGGNRHSTVRVGKVTYRVQVEVDGKLYNAYSREVYDRGDKVEVLVKRSGKGLAKIVGYAPADKQPADGVDNDGNDEGAKTQISDGDDDGTKTQFEDADGGVSAADDPKSENSTDGSGNSTEENG